MTWRRAMRGGGGGACAALILMGAAANGADTPDRNLALIAGDASKLPRAPVPPDRRRNAYLLAYFKDATHSLYFATSPDGYSFTDINDGKPVLDGRIVAEQKGIRDPYIARGPDGAFYMAMTDLHIRAKQEGLRTSEWERPVEEYGWGNNRSLILMKSFDLVHWTHHVVHVDSLFASQADIGAAWAPEMIWDTARRRMMVYYTTRHRNGVLRMVYSYADRNFTTLVDEPKPLFAYSKTDVITIDGDITRVGKRYRLFYGTNQPPARIEQAVSPFLNHGYIYNGTKINSETVDTEAPNVWRRHGTDTYVLMYDAFGLKPHGNMGFSETRDFVHFHDLGHFNEPGSPMKATNFFEPKHGAVMAITPREVDRLRSYFHPRR